MDIFWKILVIFLQLWMSVCPAEDSLKLVHVIMRHCERSPDAAELYPKSPYYNERVFAPNGYGQLTNKGKLDCYNVGKALRQRYGNFLDSAYHYLKMEGISSSYSRTKETLQLVLAGLYPPTKELIWSSDLNWLPIATYYEKKSTDMVVLPQLTDWFKEEHRKVEGIEEMKAFKAQYKNLGEYIAQQIGEEITYERMIYLVSGMQITDGLGHKLPEWMGRIYPNITTKYYSDYMGTYYLTRKLKRMTCGYLLRKIVQETEMKINGTSDKQIVIFSGHDVTIITLFQILEVWNKTNPPMGSYCTLEVHNINGTYGFKVYFFNGTQNEPYPIHIPGFGEFLPFDDLKIQKKEYIYLDDLEETSGSMRNRINTFIIVFVFCIVSRL